MAGRVLNLEGLISPDQLGCEIARMFHTWDMGKAGKKAEWRELYKYIYATDTSTTSNSAQPWKNTTVTPKLTQIRDNLYANYIASMFPRRRWLLWEGNTDTDEEKADAIKAYMSYVIAQPDFKSTVSKLVLDYIDNGNAIAMPEWSDERVEREGKMQAGYVGPVARRLSPFDTVFNPTAPDFRRTPKIISSLISIGELAEYLQRLSHDDEEKETYQKLFDYLMDYRETARSQGGEIKTKDEFYRVDGFTSFRHYLESDYVEVLTFYGDLYDKHAKKFYKNHIIQVVDRHKVIRNAPNPSDLGHPSIVHSGWRPRQDNLWAMGPLDNLVGLQYRLDHIENGKADFFDLTNYPPLKIKGYVEDFEWAAFSRRWTSNAVFSPGVRMPIASFGAPASSSIFASIAWSSKLAWRGLCPEFRTSTSPSSPT